MKIFKTRTSLLLQSLYMQFYNHYYHETTDTPMGACTSPWFADITIEALELNALDKLKSNICLKPQIFFSNPLPPFQQ